MTYISLYRRLPLLPIHAEETKRTSTTTIANLYHERDTHTGHHHAKLSLTQIQQHKYNKATTINTLIVIILIYAYLYTFGSLMQCALHTHRSIGYNATSTQGWRASTWCNDCTHQNISTSILALDAHDTHTHTHTNISNTVPIIMHNNTHLLLPFIATLLHYDRHIAIIIIATLRHYY
jgi:hypothetical protein